MKYVIIAALLIMTLSATVAVAQDSAAGHNAADTQAPAVADEQKQSGLRPEDRGMVAAFVAASVAFITGISVIGAAYAVAHIGSAAIGAASEKPEMMGRSLVFVALGEGLAVLGLAVAFVLMFTVLMELI